MEKICANCANWDNGICTVKYGYNITHPGQRCDEVLMPASDTPDGKTVMFFKPKEEEEIPQY